MIDSEKNTPNKNENPSSKEEAPSPADNKAGLTKEDGINAFRSFQDKKPRPEDILYNKPDDIDNPEDIISG